MTISTIRSRIQRKGRGSVFTPSDFLAVGSRTSVDKALSRLAQDGFIRRLSQGVYDFPKISPRIGPLSPNPDDVADAIVRKDGHKLQIPPSRAANLLGLTNQVPAKSVFLTNGRTRTRQVGRTSITLKQAAPKNLVAAGTTAGTVFQALRYVGRNGINDQIVHRVAKQITPSDAKDLVKQSTKAPAWMQPVAQRIAEAV